ncbi:hypothetical protein [Klebsiella quasipneumoniae]|uniref:hypothetical protein n=1 Tax=Klebsiella quasipneumoniae TaxID=1463165 RepID=UPI0015DC23F8|nr:hypothetical protein [Klebsiella quasipneumoniae]BBS49789.1 hypothetical protein WP5S18E05_P10730 [Klebsiella quasipneumoniae]
MRMSVLFAVVAIFTGINLVITPYLKEPALWGVLLAAVFILINFVAGKMRLWSGIAWIIAAGIIISMMVNGYVPDDKFRYLISVFSCLSSTWYAVVEFRREKITVDS